MSVALAVCGIFFFLYGMLLSNTILSAFVLASRASLLGDSASEVQELIERSVTTVPTVPHEFFLLAATLVTAGAVVDVWRRLEKIQVLQK